MVAVMGVSMIIRNTAGILVSTAAGFLVWALSPKLTGAPLPWDAPWPFYSCVFLAAGLVVSPIAPRIWPCVIEAWVGQAVALFVLPLDRTTNMWGEGAWWTLGILATGAGSLIVAAGWVAGRVIRKRLSR